MKQVFVAQHPTEAHLVRGLLETNGITAVVRGESLFSARGEAPATPDTLPSVCVVDDSDAPRALAVLSEYGSSAVKAGSHETAWVCPACGERIESQFTECWNCGASQPIGVTEQP